MSKSINLVSCWSKAGVGTSIVLEYSGPDSKKRSRIVLDCGATPIYEDAIRASTVLVSHSHLDHVGAIFSHARAHSVAYSGSIPTYYVPEMIREKVERAKAAMEALDGEERQSPMKLVGVQPGDEMELPVRGLFVRVFEVSHASCTGAVGYVIGSKHSPVLKEEYRGLNSKEIRELKSKGVSIKTEPVEELEVAYTGDTSVEGLRLKSIVGKDERKARSALYLQQAFQCRLLFCEATFLDDSNKARNLSTTRGHLHIEDIVNVLEEHKFARGDRQLVLMHISGRYSANEALNLIADSLPSHVASRCLVAISSHLEPFRRRDKFWKNLLQDNGCVLLSKYIVFRKQ